MYGLLKYDRFIFGLKKYRWKIVDVAKPDHHPCLLLVYAVHGGHSEIILNTKQNVQNKINKTKNKRRKENQKKKKLISNHIKLTNV